MQSISLAPDSNASKFMNLGQILEGFEAVQAYERGIQILQIEMQKETFDVRRYPFLF